jgi:GH24 family phage-related lysozyme (muramidase)
VDSLPKTIMTFSAQGVDMLKRAESIHLTPYDDQTGRDTDHYLLGATIGYGHLISSGEWSTCANGITQTQADALFNSDLQPFVYTVNQGLTAGVTQNEFDALVILCFNIGQGAFLSSSALQLVNNSQASTSYNSVDEAWRAFNRSQGQENSGLNNRRNAELRIYNNGDYSGW